MNEIPEALSFLLNSIVNLPRLATINLNDNAFGLNTQAPLVEFLSSHAPLQHLHLNNNGLGPHAGILIADALSSLHGKKAELRRQGLDVPELETVICGRNRLENGSMTAWAKAFRLNNKVQVVKMVQNGIRPEGVGHLLSEGLYHATQIRILDLQDNTFTLKGAKELVKVVSAWTLLQELGVSDTMFTSKGGSLLFDALSNGKNDKLQTIRLQYADIRAKDLLKMVAVARDSLPSLKKLDLNGNKFSEDDDSLTALRELLTKRKEDLGGNAVAEDEWGLDTLSDLDDDDDENDENDENDEDDEDDDDEDDDDEDDVHDDEKEKKEVDGGEKQETGTGIRVQKLANEAEEAQDDPTVQQQVKDVDELSKYLARTVI